MAEDSGKGGISGKEWATLVVTAMVYTAGALIFLFSTFVTAAYQEKFEHWLDGRLNRIESKLDRTLQQEQPSR